MRLLENFDAQSVAGDGTPIFVRRDGTGAPLLLLHGFPQTHLMWHRVAPQLASRFHVVCADLRGYGSSGKPVSTADHAPYSKRAMARDLVRVMSTFGFERFCVAGHDRGARVAYRMALDFPAQVERLAVFDIIPTSEAFARADARFVQDFWPWSLLAQSAPLPERLIAADPGAIIDNAFADWGSDPGSFPAALRTAYTDALRNPETIHSICEEYRAAATLDVSHDSADRAAGKLIECPVLVLWSKGGPLDTWYRDTGGPLAIWGDWAAQVTGRAIGGGHFFPEQNPDETVSELAAFLQASHTA